MVRSRPSRFLSNIMPSVSPKVLEPIYSNLNSSISAGQKGQEIQNPDNSTACLHMHCLLFSSSPWTCEPGITPTSHSPQSRLLICQGPAQQHWKAARENEMGLTRPLISDLLSYICLNNLPLASPWMESKLATAFALVLGPFISGFTFSIDVH